jgi:6-phosphogluconolactonase
MSATTGALSPGHFDPALLTVAEDPGALAEAAAALVLHWCAEAVAARGHVSVALAGGSTPRRCYELLALAARQQRASLAAWDVYLGDERVVPPDDAGSNGRMLRETLVDSGALPAERLHRVIEAWDPAEAPETAASRYAALLPPAFDVLLLGLGTDGHTASLFPGSPALDERDLAVVVVQAPVAPRLRVTLTPPVLAAARHVAVLTSGAEKAPAVQRALHGPADVRTTPAQLLRGAHWLIDRPAAALLGRAL